jgi:hypothetical protein
MSKKPKKNKKKSHIKQKAFEDLNISALEDHQRKGGILSPPLANINNVSLISWRDHAINEVLWAAILRGNCGQHECLRLFRQVITNARKRDPDFKDTFISHSALSVLTDEQFDTLMQPIIESLQSKELLRCLLYLECLPDRHHWLRHIEEPDSQNSHAPYLMQAVASCMDHQSQESTDIRWLKLMYCAIVQGRLHFPEGMDEILEGFRLYPDYGDQRSIRPTIRSMEMTLRNTSENNGHPYELPEKIGPQIPPSWSAPVWKECLEKTECFTGELKKPSHTENDWYFDQFLGLHHAVANHFMINIQSTNTDPRRDSAYGLVLYSLFIAITIGRNGYHRRAEGRIMLRTIVECFITMKYLTYKDDEKIWKQYRSYGTGQAKLAFLKNLREETVPDFIDLDDLQRYANEDLWQEHSDINLKPWSDKNLRKMAEEAKVKDFYDKYYDWSSGYVHGNWGAIRDTVFTVCLNPLHRFHRVPFMPRLDLPSVQPDAARIINIMLDTLNQLYPSFKPRVKHPKS